MHWYQPEFTRIKKIDNIFYFGINKKGISKKKRSSKSGKRKESIYNIVWDKKTIFFLGKNSRWRCWKGTVNRIGMRVIKAILVDKVRVAHLEAFSRDWRRSRGFWSNCNGFRLLISNSRRNLKLIGITKEDGRGIIKNFSINRSTGWGRRRRHGLASSSKRSSEIIASTQYLCSFLLFLSSGFCNER